MAEYWTLLNRLRHDLGKRFTVAEEHTADPGRINLLIRMQRRDRLLIVVLDTRWLAVLARENTMGTRVEYKHLSVLIRNFFAYPEIPPFDTFIWPGTQESREELRRALNPRRQRVAADARK